VTADRRRDLVGRRFVERLRHPQADFALLRAAQSNSVMLLADAKHLLLESERSDGVGIATPMWFVVIDDTVYVRSETAAGKVKRIWRAPLVKVVPCTARGKPTRHEYIQCMARIVAGEQQAQAEQALRRGYGLFRRLSTAGGSHDHTYFALTPLTKSTPVPEDVALAIGTKAVRDTRRERPPDDAA
jgi:hypothetical protein